MSVIAYILIASFSLSLFFLVYKLIFNNETNFRHLRFYLMGSVLLSLLLPLNRYTLEMFNKQPKVAQIQVVTIPEYTPDLPAALPGKTRADWGVIAFKGYCLITVVLIGRVLLQLVILAWQYLKSDKIRYKNQVVLLNHRFRSTFSFFNWIFISRSSSSDEDLEQIIAHERIHASQLHTIDLIIIELLTAVMWFNPLIWMMRNTVKLVHEYLADEGALNTGIDRLRYQVLLINQVTEERLIRLSSSFNHSLIKKRMNMMKENKFNRRSSKKILALAPLSILLFFLVAIVNGLFPERIHGTDTKKASETAAFFSPDPLPVINQALPGDSIKKKTVVKVIHAESPGDTLVTQTIEVIVSGDTTKTIKVIGPNGKTKMEHSGDLIFISEDDEIKDLTGTNRDSVKVIKYVNINKDIDSQQDIKYDVMIDDKKEVIIIRGSKDATWTTRDEELSRTLVIIDGVKHTKRDALAGINPDDIIEMNVIKDPDSIKKYTDKDIETVIILKTRKGNH